MALSQLPAWAPAPSPAPLEKKPLQGLVPTRQPVTKAKWSLGSVQGSGAGPGSFIGAHICGALCGNPGAGPFSTPGAWGSQCAAGLGAQVAV